MLKSCRNNHILSNGIGDHGDVRLCVLLSRFCGSLSAISASDEAFHRFHVGKSSAFDGACLWNGWLRGRAVSRRLFLPWHVSGDSDNWILYEVHVRQKEYRQGYHGEDTDLQHGKPTYLPRERHIDERIIAHAHDLPSLPPSARHIAHSKEPNVPSL
jgi:hypothetical protein